MSDFYKTRLYADIADRDDTIEQLQQRVGELEGERDSVCYLNDSLSLENEQLNAHAEKIKNALPDKVVDLVRCGIGGNYGGEYYNEALDKYYHPLVDILKQSPKTSLAKHDLELLKGFSLFLRDKHKIYALPLAEQYAKTFSNGKDGE